MANPSTPNTIKIKFGEFESGLSPLHRYGSAWKKLCTEWPVLEQLYLEDENTRGTPFGGDDDFDTDIVLKQNLSLNNTALDPDKRTAPLLVHGEWPKIELQGTSIQPFVDAHDNAADAAAAVACVKALFDEFTNEFSGTVSSSMKKMNVANKYKVTSARGGVVVSDNEVKYAVCMLGPCLPKLDDLARILKKPNVPGHIKKIEWMKGGALGMTSMSIKKNPDKVYTTRCRVIRCRVIRCRAPRCRALTRVTLLSTSPFTGACQD